MKKIAFYILGLIALYIISAQFLGFNEVLKTVALGASQGVATLQGRDVKGVTK